MNIDSIETERILEFKNLGVITDETLSWKSHANISSSDFHNCICVSSKMFAPSHSKHKITYRSMKHFSENAFRNDVDSIPFHVYDIFDDIDDVYWMHDKLLMSVLDKHAPIKTKTVNTQVPYMNSALRKAINQRNMWRSKYFRNRNDKQLRMKYVMWRNRVVKLHKNSIINYFTHRCHGNVGRKNFYKTLKPFCPLHNHIIVDQKSF